MQRSIRVCFYNAEDATGQQIRQAIDEMPHLQVVAECPDWEQVRECLNTSQVDMVLANLDPDLEQTLQTVQLMVRLVPEIGVVGVSQKTDPQAIISAMRAGCGQFVCAPIEIEDLNNAVTRLQATRVTTSQSSRRICVIGTNGGVGATTVACNLALELSHLTDRPSGLVDLHLEFGDVADAFDSRPKYSIADLCADGADLDRTMVEAAMHVLPCNVHVMPRPERIEKAHQVAPESVGRLLNLLSGIYQNVVIDLPRGYNFFNAVAVEHADLILLVTELCVPAIRNARRLYELLLQMGAPEDRVEIVVNRYKADFERISLDDVERHFARPVFGMIPNDYRRVQASLDLGHPILADSPNSPARLAIHEIAKRLTADTRSEEVPPIASKGFFTRWWASGKKEPAR